MNYIELSKEISYALRHAPHEYGLELDAEGWVGIEQLIDGFKEKKGYKGILEGDIINMIEASKKKRHECFDGKIRALYGHSLEKKIVKDAKIPPAVLYHGTAKRFIESIMEQGILAQKRQYVHFSEDIETAIIAGNRHDATPVILKVDARSAHADGILFFHGGEKIWFSELIPPQYLEINEAD